MKLVTTKFKSGRLHEEHVVATWNLGNHLSICFWAQGNQEKPVSRWPVAGPSECWPVASSPAFKVKKKKTHTHTTKKLRTFYEIRRLFVVMTGNWVWLHCRFVFRMCRRRISLPKKKQFTQKRPLCLLGRLYYTWRLSFAAVHSSNVGESGTFRLGNTYCRCCGNDLTWGGVKLK